MLVDVDEEVANYKAPPQPPAPVVEKKTIIDLPSVHTDPFAPREGKTLTWTNVNMTLVCIHFVAITCLKNSSCFFYFVNFLLYSYVPFLDDLYEYRLRKQMHQNVNSSIMFGVKFRNIVQQLLWVHLVLGKFDRINFIIVFKMQALVVYYRT